MRSLVFILLATAGVRLWAQSTSAFLGMAVTDKEYQVVELQQAYLTSHNFSSPWIREVDVRIRTTNLSTDIDDYRLRLGLINPMEIKANNDYKRLLAGQYESRKRASLNDIMLRRYQLLMEHYFVTNWISLLEEQVSVISSYEKTVWQIDPDLKDLVELQHDLAQLQLSQITEKQKLLALQTDTDSTLSGIDWQQIALIQPVSVLRMLDSLSQVNYLYAIAMDELQLKEQLLKIKEKEAYSNLGFLQTTYDPDRGQVINDKVGFQLGIQIPIVNTDRPKLQRERLKMIDEQVEVKSTVEEDDLNTGSLRGKMESCLEQLQVLSAHDDMLARYKAAYAKSPADLATYSEIRDYEFYLKKEKLEVFCAFLNHYIAFLHLKGQLAGEQMINYLEEGWPVFEIR